MQSYLYTIPGSPSSSSDEDDFLSHPPRSPFLIPASDLAKLYADRSFQSFRKQFTRSSHLIECVSPLYSIPTPKKDSLTNYLSPNSSTLFCPDHIPYTTTTSTTTTSTTTTTTLLHHSILSYLLHPLLTLHTAASHHALHTLSLSSPDLELAFTGPARSAFAWLQCVIATEPLFVSGAAVRGASRPGCPACMVNITLQSEPTARLALAAARWEGGTVGKVWWGAMERAMKSDEEWWGEAAWLETGVRAGWLEEGVREMVGQCGGLEIRGVGGGCEMVEEEEEEEEEERRSVGRARARATTA